MKQFVLTKNTWCLEKASLNFAQPRFSDFWRSVNSYHCPLKCIYWFGLCRVFTAAQAFPWLPPTGAAVQLGCVGPQCRGSSCCGAWAGGRSGFSGRGSRAPEHRLSSCDMRALLPLSMWDLPESGTKPTSPALVGGFFTIEPPGKPISLLF